MTSRAPAAVFIVLIVGLILVSNGLSLFKIPGLMELLKNNYFYSVLETLLHAVYAPIPLIPLLAVVTASGIAVWLRRRGIEEECFLLRTRRGISIETIYEAYSRLEAALCAAGSGGAKIEYLVKGGEPFAKLVVKGKPENIAFIEQELRELDHAITYTTCQSLPKICYIHEAELPRILNDIGELILVDWKGYSPQELKNKAVKVIDLSTILVTEEKIQQLQRLSQLIEELGLHKPTIVIYYPLEALNTTKTEHFKQTLLALNRETEIIIVVDNYSKPSLDKCNEKLKK